MSINISSASQVTPTCPRAIPRGWLSDQFLKSLLPELNYKVGWDNNSGAAVDLARKHSTVSCAFQDG